jgi:hypothetical protein
MLGSRHVGKRAAAGLKADKLIRECGITWNDLLVPKLPQPAQSEPIRTTEEKLALLRDHLDLFTEWEQSFVRTVSRYRRAPSERQMEVIDRLVEQVLEESAPYDTKE